MVFSGYSTNWNCGKGRIENSDGLCADCPVGHVPNSYRDKCVACKFDEITKGDNCKTCEPGQIQMNNRRICASK